MSMCGFGSIAALAFLGRSTATAGEAANHPNAAAEEGVEHGRLKGELRMAVGGIPSPTWRKRYTGPARVERNAVSSNRRKSRSIRRTLPGLKVVPPLVEFCGHRLLQTPPGRCS